MVIDFKKIQSENRRLKSKPTKKKAVSLNLGRGKILSKPKTSFTKRDILNELKKSRGYQVTRDEKLEDTDYNRSPYFNEEFRKEKKEGGKWLS